MITTNRRRLSSIAVALAAAVLLSACTVEAGDEAAHAIAAKFAESDLSGAESTPAPAPDSPEPITVEVINSAQPVKADEQLKAEEAEMLARARAEAEERRRAEQEQAQAAEQAKIEQERLRSRKAAEEKRQREIEEQRQAAEARRLAEIAAQEEARRIAEEQRRMAEEEERRAAEFQRSLEEEQKRIAAEAKRRAEIAAQEEARRAAEARRLIAVKQLEQEERLRVEQIQAIAALAAAAEDARKPRVEPQRRSEHLIREQQVPSRKSFSSPHALGGPAPQAIPDPLQGLPRSSRVTILLVMEPGSRGIRRFNKTADPILCVDTHCYISNGPGQPARAMTRPRALGPAVTLGTRAGYCRRSLACVFRGVDFKHTMAVVQPIDLRILRHDRREPRAVTVDPTCRIEGHRLTCGRPILAQGYKLWVLPEIIAERAGALALEMAVRAGLPGSPATARAGID